MALGLLGALLACPPGPGEGERGDRCDEHTDCEDDLFCIDEECARPYARRWRLTVLGAKISLHDPNGEDWDNGGTGLPDPFVRVEVNGQVLLQTVTREDSNNAAWSEGVSFVLDRSTQVEISVWDDDSFLLQPVPTLITTTGDQIILEEELRQGTVTAFATTGRADGGAIDAEVTTLTYEWRLDE